MEMERRRADELLRLEDMDRSMRREKMAAAAGRGGGGDHYPLPSHMPSLMDSRVHQSWLMSDRGSSSNNGHQHYPGQQQQQMVGGYNNMGMMQHGGGGHHQELMPPPQQHQPHQPFGRYVEPRSGRSSGDASRGNVVGRAGVVRRDGVAVAVRKTVSATSGRGGGGSSSRSSAFNRLGPKMPVKARLGGSSSSKGSADR